MLKKYTWYAAVALFDLGLAVIVLVPTGLITYQLFSLVAGLASLMDLMIFIAICWIMFMLLMMALYGRELDNHFEWLVEKFCKRHETANRDRIRGTE